MTPVSLTGPFQDHFGTAANANANTMLIPQGPQSNRDLCL